MGHSDFPKRKDGIQKVTRISTAFSEGVSNLLTELHLAIHWDRPSILLAVYKSESVRIKAEDFLEGDLGTIDQNVKRIQIEKEQPDVTQTILQTNDLGHVVFSVTGIRNGGGEGGKDTYRALNMFRETFIDRRLRTIFWLTENEARNLPLFAPDFWAFRHRVVEFALDRVSKADALPAGALLWINQDTISNPQILLENIQYYNRLLADLPENQESSSAKTEILFRLAHLEWLRGENEGAQKKLISGLELIERFGLSHLKTRFQNGLAIIHYESQNKEEALTLLKEAVENNPKDGISMINLGVTYQALGQRRNAVLTSRRAVRLDPKNPRIWNALGHLYLAGGQIEAAQSSFEHALDLDPQNLSYHLGLAACHFKAGETEKAEQSLTFIERASNPQSNYYKACKKALQGHSDTAIQLLKTGLMDKEFAASALQRDPILHYILESDMINSIV